MGQLRDEKTISPPVRVGLIIYGSLDTLSGGYLYDRTVVEYLRRHGDQVEVISLPWRNYVRHLGDNVSASLQRQLAASELDILIQDELNHPSLFWLNRRLRASVGCPFVSIVHHLRCSEPRPAWQNWFYGWIERHYLNSVDAFVFNSCTTRKEVASLTKANQPHVVAYPGGDRLEPEISDQGIVARANRAGPLRLFFLGNLTPRKGLHILIDALSELPRAGWHLSVAGGLSVDRAYSAHIMQQVNSYELTEQVHILGPLNEDQVGAQLEHSHLLVLPSLYEGFGIAYIEGMGYGLPAIATTAGAAHEIISHGENGYLVPPGESHGLANCLKEILSDRKRLVEMSLKARRRYAAHPTWEQTAGRIREFLHRVSKSFTIG